MATPVRGIWCQRHRDFPTTHLLAVEPLPPVGAWERAACGAWSRNWMLLGERRPERRCPRCLTHVVPLEQS